MCLGNEFGRGISKPIAGDDGWTTIVLTKFIAGNEVG